VSHALTFRLCLVRAKRYDGICLYYVIWREGKIGKKRLDGKRILGGLKAHLRATDHTSSNIISRDNGYDVDYDL
jgi:hypothetical protein